MVAEGGVFERFAETADLKAVERACGRNDHPESNGLRFSAAAQSSKRLSQSVICFVMLTGAAQRSPPVLDPCGGCSEMRNLFRDFKHLREDVLARIAVEKDQ